MFGSTLTKTIKQVALLFFLPLLLHGQIDLEYKSYAPIFSPFGKSITWYAMVEGNWDIYTNDLGSKDVMRMTTSDAFEGEPTWSPHGERLALTSDRDGINQIYMLSLRSGAMEPVTTSKEEKDYPCFSPDGNGIYYRKQHGKQWYLYRWDLDIREEEKVSSIPLAGRFRLSTQGKTISFVTQEQKDPMIIRIDLEGYLVSGTNVPFGYPGNPHFSDELGLFVFDAHADGLEESGDGKWELWTIKPDGKDLQRLTNNNVDDWGPYWSPHGKKVVYSGSGRNNTGYEIFLMELESQRLTQISKRK